MRGRKTAGPVDLDEMNLAGVVPDEGVEQLGVRVVVSEDEAGHRTAMFWPVTFDRLSPAARSTARVVAELVAARRQAAAEIDDLVPELREQGASWGQIGWLVGISGEGARLRWGGESPTS